MHDTGRLTPSMFSTLDTESLAVFTGARPDDLPSPLRLEHCWLLRERIDALQSAFALIGTEFVRCTLHIPPALADDPCAGSIEVC